ncbi:MAG: hypothetical protein GAK35_01037 [Herbaspirillum frisingense]|uniref:ASCH domain-containing protein n=1 Tax=Herbaspirillum frisingense TaxID=92645 RepID=A0A7V8FYR6_9BURK|nr:MAG: hypothetical protein GAK35_01037 [Herbaspirillum frisingense]
MKALSIRQPWATLIVLGYKDVENRSWPTRHRGPTLIHAAKGMTRGEYDDAKELVDQLICRGAQIHLPAFEELPRGGFVGVADFTGCVDDSPSPWFFGKFGFTLARARPVPFTPFKGALSFFDVPPAITDQVLAGAAAGASDD